jgi:hypothetical protein
MYIIINQTRRTTEQYRGNFPGGFDEMLDNNEKIIIISLYSNTIKVPYYYEGKGIGNQYWKWEDYKFDPNTIADFVFCQELGLN